MDNAAFEKDKPAIELEDSTEFVLKDETKSSHGELDLDQTEPLQSDVKLDPDQTKSSDMSDGSHQGETKPPQINGGPHRDEIKTSDTNGGIHDVSCEKSDLLDRVSVLLAGELKVVRRW